MITAVLTVFMAEAATPESQLSSSETMVVSHGRSDAKYVWEAGEGRAH